MCIEAHRIGNTHCQDGEKLKGASPNNSETDEPSNRQGLQSGDWVQRGIMGSALFGLC
jgi:hypothetical protein